MVQIDIKLMINLKQFKITNGVRVTLSNGIVLHGAFEGESMDIVTKEKNGLWIFEANKSSEERQSKYLLNPDNIVSIEYEY